MFQGRPCGTPKISLFQKGYLSPDRKVFRMPTHYNIQKTKNINNTNPNSQTKTWAPSYNTLGSVKAGLIFHPYADLH
jgi:hypothetical protein